MKTYSDRPCQQCWETYNPKDAKESIKNLPPSASLKFCSKVCELAARRDINQEKRRIAFETGEYPGKIQYLKLRFLVFKRDKFLCRYCGRSPSNGAILHIDHIIPKSKGGKLSKDNLVTACFECNEGKSDILLNEREIQNISRPPANHSGN